VSTGTSTFNDISVTGTGSFAYIESVTGSAKIVGESFIVLENDTPALRYAGIKVYDSGSSAATASLEWDGLSDNWIIAEESGNTGVVLTGVTGSRGSEALPTINVLQKGAGHHSLTNSNITDDGTGVTVSTAVTSSNGFFSSGVGQASKFNGQVSAFSYTSTGAYKALSSFSTTAGFELGEATAPKKTGYYTVYTNAGAWSGDGNAGGLYIIDQSGSDAFVGHIGNFSSPYEAANSASFVIQGGANADSNYGNTIMYANEANGFPHFVKSTYFDKPVFMSSSLQVTGSIDATAGIIGNLTGTASLATTASFASTASHVDPLVQNVDVTGGINLSGTVVSSNSTGFTVGSSTAANQYASSINYYDG